MRLRKNGRLVVESYHSLEDITVKRFMNQGLTVDVPSSMPVIPDDAQPFFESLTRGAIKASNEEIAHNTRSASVRLRAIELKRDLPAHFRKRFEDEALGVLSADGKSAFNRISRAKGGR